MLLCAFPSRLLSWLGIGVTGPHFGVSRTAEIDPCGRPAEALAHVPKLSMSMLQSYSLKGYWSGHSTQYVTICSSSNVERHLAYMTTTSPRPSPPRLGLEVAKAGRGLAGLPNRRCLLGCPPPVPSDQKPQPRANQARAVGKFPRSSHALISSQQDLFTPYPHPLAGRPQL